MKNNRMGARKGFTIVETMLAMVFVGTLMIAIATLIINVSETYSKEITVKNVNETARNIIDDLKRSISASPTFGGVTVEGNVYNEAGARGCMSINGGFLQEGDSRFPGECEVDYNATSYYRHDYRRFCTGLVSYIWNVHSSIIAEQGVSAGNSNWISPDGITNTNINRWEGDVNREVRLVKVRDLGREYCAVNTDAAGVVTGPRIEHIRLADSETAVELIIPSEEDLILYNFTMFRLREGENINRTTGQVFYSGSFVLGTMRGVELTGPGLSLVPQCIAPGAVNSSNPNSIQEYYCSVNKFNFAQRAMGASQ